MRLVRKCFHNIAKLVLGNVEMVVREPDIGQKGFFAAANAQLQIVFMQGNPAHKERIGLPSVQQTLLRNNTVLAQDVFLILFLLRQPRPHFAQILRIGATALQLFLGVFLLLEALVEKRPQHAAGQHGNRHGHHGNGTHHVASLLHDKHHRNSRRQNGSHSHGKRRPYAHGYGRVVFVLALRRRIDDEILALDEARKTKSRIEIRFLLNRRMPIKIFVGLVVFNESRVAFYGERILRIVQRDKPAPHGNAQSKNGDDLARMQHPACIWLEPNRIDVHAVGRTAIPNGEHAVVVRKNSMMRRHETRSANDVV